MSTLSDLEHQLRSLSHDTSAMDLVKQFAGRLKNTRERQAVFNAPGALTRVPPIEYDQVVAQGLISPEDDRFALLQGDVVATDTAYHFGERLTNMRFLVVNATCDLVPGRREFTSLLPVFPISSGNTAESSDRAKRLLGELLSFVSTRRMYLPPLPGDLERGVIANAVEFDRIAQAYQADILTATRIASLSLVGWRIFAAHLRGNLTRAGENEVAIRQAVGS